MAGVVGVSNSQLTKAGDILRSPESWTDADGFGPFHRAMECVAPWRKSFAPALNAATVGLRSAVRTLGVPDDEFDVKGRHKKEASIVAKLRKRPSMRLPQMEDIAGCRAVVPDMSVARQLHKQIERRSQNVQVVHVDDYLDVGRPGGYRALHLHTKRQVRTGTTTGTWAVEIQIRTVAQHAWARTVEAYDEAFGTDIKHESDDDPGFAAFKALANYLRAVELDILTEELVDSLRGQIEQLRVILD